MDGADIFTSVAAGFQYAVSFSHAAIDEGGTVSVFDDLHGKGNLLASVAVPGHHLEMHCQLSRPVLPVPCRQHQLWRRAEIGVR